MSLFPSLNGFISFLHTFVNPVIDSDVENKGMCISTDFISLLNCCGESLAVSVLNLFNSVRIGHIQ